MKLFTSSKWIVLALILIQQLVHPSSFAQSAPGTHEKRSIDVEGSDDDLWYWEYLPAGYDPIDSKLYPLIIFLHGAGKRRDVTSDPAIQEQQLDRVLQEGIPYEINNGANMCFTVNGVEKCFIVLSPQRDESGYYWPDITEDLLQYAWTHYKIDPDRIYFTGLSMGGIGTIDYIQSTRFKAADIAAAAVAPGGQAVVEGTTECDIPARDIAFWAVHGNNDTNVTYPGPMKTLISQINDCIPTPSPKAYLHLIPGVGHNVWADFYRITSPKYSPTVYEWFLMNPKGASNTIPNQAPTVNAGPDVEVTGTTHTLSPTTLADYDGTTLADFDGIGTSGYDGSLASFQWTQSGGPSCTLTTNANRSLTVTNMNQDGTYTFKLTGTDHHGRSTFDLVSIVKSGGTNAPPEANAGADKNITLPGNSVTLQGSGTDSDGTIVSYSWAQHSGPSSATIVNPNSASTSVTDLVQGTYVFRLTVTDNDNAPDSDDVTVTVNAASGDIDHAWADFFDIETGGSIPADWNDPAVDPVLVNLGTGDNWTAVDATKPTFSVDKLVFDNAHRIDGYNTTHPPVFELWLKARFTGEHGNLLSMGNQVIFGAASNGDYVCNGLTPQAGDANEHVFRIVMNGANSIFQMDGGPEVMFDEGTSLGTKLVMGQTNSGGNAGDFEIKRFQRTAHGTLLTAQEVADKWSFHGFDGGGGDIDHAWADFFDIETGGSIPADWNEPAVDPVLVNLGTGDNWTAVDATKPTFSVDKLVFDNAHRIDGYNTTHPPVFELWLKARFTGEHGNLLSMGNQVIFGAASNGDYVCNGLAPQPGDVNEHVFRIVMNGANSIFQMDGGPEVMFDEGTSLGTKLVMGQTNSGGNAGDFEIKRFQRTAHGTLLTAQEVTDKWLFHGFASQQSSTMDVSLSPQSSETEEPENYMIAVYDNFGGHLKSFRYSARPSEIYGLDLRSHVAQQGTYIFHIINSESKVVIKRILFIE